MGKTWLEVRLVSAWGLRRTSSVFKLQWFVVGWINPNNKYCSKISDSGSTNPIWNTRFTTSVDKLESNIEDLALHVEVYCREPIFLRESLQGTATIVLKEFLDKYIKNSELPNPVEEKGSFELWKRNSSKPQGFVDVSIRISEEKEELSSYKGNHEGFDHMDHSNSINSSNERGSSLIKPVQSNLAPKPQHENLPPINSVNARQVPIAEGFSNSSIDGSSYSSQGGPSHLPPQVPPPPPPPSNAGFIPTFFPKTDHINMPSSGETSWDGAGTSVEKGIGAGALAAGAVIFGDDFMSGFDVPFGLQDDTPAFEIVPPS
ncbi:hypothetical protein NMG60_11012119 [Bertholletia excelsa]